MAGLSNHVHTPQILSRYLSLLTPNGTLQLNELILLDASEVADTALTRKQADLVSLLKLTGFVDVEVTQVDTLTDDQVAAVFPSNAELAGQVGLARVTLKKPAYEIGQKVTLNFKKKPKQTEEKKKAWTVSVNDDDDELLDDDMLLDEEDKVKPSKEALARPDDCEMVDGRRKACKNCTCGRASMADGEAEEEESNNVVSLDLLEEAISEVDPTPNKVGGCGSCALGDAFRCSTCPYLGMPAFNPGEKVMLGGMFGKDDIDV